MSQQKNAPPPAPVLVMDEKPKLVESDASVESSKLPEEDTTPKGKSEPKELTPEVVVPKTQADLGVGASDNLNIGSNEFEGMKK